MRTIILPILTAFLFLGCQGSDTTTIHHSPDVPSVTLTSHLGGPLDGDPILQLGQTVRVISAESEPPSGRKESLIVKLPTETPFDGPDEQYFLRGYAIGKLSSHNMPFM